MDLEFRPVIRAFVVTPPPSPYGLWRTSQLRMFIRALVAPRTHGLQARPFRQIFLANSLAFIHLDFESLDKNIFLATSLLNLR
jgi:hypothetical protein